MTKWNADPSSPLKRRWGKSSHELGMTGGNASCPDIWELANGDVAVIGTDMTDNYSEVLPAGVTIDSHERLVVIPRAIIQSAKMDIPDA